VKDRLEQVMSSGVEETARPGKPDFVMRALTAHNKFRA
jgi:hypothetical protein